MLDESPYKAGNEIIIWIFFFLCTFILMIVILNLLIAFIGGTYTKVV